MKESRKIEIYRQIQYLLDHSKQPTPRDVGLTEKEFRELGDGTQFRLEKLEEEGDILDNYVICELHYPAKLLLATSPDLLVPPVRSQVFVPRKSIFAWMLLALWKKLLDSFWAILITIITTVAALYAAYYFGLLHHQATPTSQSPKPAVTSKP